MATLMRGTFYVDGLRYNARACPPMKALVLGLSLMSALGPIACAKSPTSPAGTLTVAVASPLAPANGTGVANSAQPVTLTVRNARTTDPNVPVSYTFEVAGDAGFGSKLVTRDVSQTGDRTSLTLERLPADRQYFWRVRATAGDTSGTFSAPVAFTIGPDVVLQPPSPSRPVSGAIVSTTRPTLTVNNAARTGSVGTVLYRFEVATDGAFADVAATGVVAEGTAQTSFTLASDLAYTATYYWRARAVDSAHDIKSAFSTTESFRTPLVDPKSYLTGTPGS